MATTLWSWAAQTAEGLLGLRIAWTWAFLEAMVLPLPPEILLIPLALARPELALGLAAAAVLGSLTGGCVSYAIGRRYGDGAVSLLVRIPGAGRARVTWTAAWLKQFGVRFIAVSPWLVLPYKITSVLSGHQRIAWWRYLLAGTIGRGTRLISLALLVSMGARWAIDAVRAHFLPALLITYGLIGLLVWFVRRIALVRLAS